MRGQRQAASPVVGGYASPEYQWQLPEGANSLNPEQLHEYRSLARMCLTYYDTLTARDPHFRTHVGEVTLKRANEYVWVARQLSIFQNGGCR